MKHTTKILITPILLPILLISFLLVGYYIPNVKAESQIISDSITYTELNNHYFINTTISQPFTLFLISNDLITGSEANPPNLYVTFYTEEQNSTMPLIGLIWLLPDEARQDSTFFVMNDSSYDEIIYTSIGISHLLKMNNTGNIYFGSDLETDIYNFTYEDGLNFEESEFLQIEIFSGYPFTSGSLNLILDYEGDEITPTPTPTPEPTDEPTPTPGPFDSTETWNIIILLVMLIVGLILALKRTLPILNFVFGMFAIAISAWTLTVAPYFGGLLQLAVIIIGIIVMVSGYKEAY